MTTTDESYLDAYREAVQRHGGSFASTLWGSPETQRLRFDVAIEFATFAGDSIIDVGCGIGDFAAHLLERGVPFEHYLGLDALAPMIETASERDLPGCEFRQADPVVDPGAMRGNPAGWICFSGTLNTMDDDTVEGLLAGAFEIASRGIVFNFLSDRPHQKWRDRDLAPARRFDTIRWLDWALERTPLVRFTQDYLDGHDATVCMRHPTDEG